MLSENDDNNTEENPKVNLEDKELSGTGDSNDELDSRNHETPMELENVTLSDEEHGTPNIPRKGTRKRNTPTYLDDYCALSEHSEGLDPRSYFEVMCNTPKFAPKYRDQLRKTVPGVV